MNWLRYKKLYFLISGLLIGIGAFGLITWGLPLGLDFRGGTILEYELDINVSEEKVVEKLEEIEMDVSSVQLTAENTFLIKLPPIEVSEKDKLAEALSELTEDDPTELRFETVGPSVGPELVKKTVYAIIIAALGILIWVAIQFKSFKFGTSAILAMLHDSFILIGSFSLLGHFSGAQVDFLFVTALLTTLSFSVHDTIVVYDRIRESQSLYSNELYKLANRAVSETMVRSLNNSFTIIFMLIALVLLGGATVRWFAAALLIGTILGTYSSPFVAVPLLVTWDNLAEKIKKVRGR